MGKAARGRHRSKAMTVSEANAILARYCVQIIRVSTRRGATHYVVQNVVYGGHEYRYRSLEEVVNAYHRRAYDS